jgi:hypothetical protein
MRSAGVCLLALLAGCGSDAQVTAVDVFASYGSPYFEQLEFRLEKDGIPTDPVTLPKVPHGLLGSPQDVVFYVPDPWAGQSITCRVRGLLSGQPALEGVPAPVTVELHEKVRCVVFFGNTMDGSAPDG